jgi:hypothetical protein
MKIGALPQAPMSSSRRRRSEVQSFYSRMQMRRSSTTQSLPHDLLTVYEIQHPFNGSLQLRALDQVVATR